MAYPYDDNRTKTKERKIIDDSSLSEYMDKITEDHLSMFKNDEIEFLINTISNTINFLYHNDYDIDELVKPDAVVESLCDYAMSVQIKLLNMKWMIMQMEGTYIED